MRKFLVLFIFIFLNCNKENNKEFNKASTSDSTNFYLKKTNNKKLDTKTRLLYNSKVYEILKNQKRDSLNKIMLFDALRVYYELNDYKNFNNASDFMLNEFSAIKDVKAVANIYNLKANNYLNAEDMDSAFIYLNKAEKLYLQVNDSLSFGKNYLLKAYVQFSVSDYYGCQQSSSSALSYLKNYEEDLSKYNAYTYIGICANELKDYDNSLQYHNKALEIAQKNKINNDLFLISRTENNIGFVYQNLNDHKKAINYFREALKEKELINKSPDLYSILIDNYAYSKFKIKDFNELPGLFYIALDVREKNDLQQGKFFTKIHLSEYYSYVNDSEKSKKYALEALKLAKSTKISGDILSSLKQLSVVDKNNSANYSNEYIRLSDSIQIAERKAKDRFARIAYETDEVIQKNTELEVKNRNLVIFLFGAVAIFFLLYAVRTQKMRNRELAFKQEQQATNQQIYNMMISHQEKVDATSNYEKNRMAQELHDGVLSKMFGTRMNLDSLNEANDEATIAMRYNYIQELKSIEQEIREISHDLSSEKGKIINNFVNIVIDLLEEQKKSFTSDLVYSIEKTISWEKLDNTAKINLYRILQESLQNSNKYANAKTVTVSFLETEENIVMKIEDDGIGFDITKKKKGIGLKNMISRTEESKGIYEIISEHGKGTITTVSIPFNKESPTQT